MFSVQVVRPELCLLPPLGGGAKSEAFGGGGCMTILKRHNFPHRPSLRSAHLPLKGEEYPVVI